MKKRFKFIEKYVDNYSDEIVNLLVREHPQIVALILSYVDKETFKKIAKYFNEEYLYEIYYRMTFTNKIKKEILDLVENYFKEKIEKFKELEIIEFKQKNIVEKFSGLDENKFLKFIEEMPDTENKKMIMEEIREKRPDIAL